MVFCFKRTLTSTKMGEEGLNLRKDTIFPKNFYGAHKAQRGEMEKMETMPYFFIGVKENYKK